MKDEEIKLPPVPSLVTETDWHQAFINYGRDAVRLNQNISQSERWQAEAWRVVVKALDDLHPNWWLTGDATGVDAAIKVITTAFNSSKPNTEPLPFNLEAAKRGDPVLHNGKEKRWIGLSSIEDGLNIVESSSGVGYAADCDLFMKPLKKGKINCVTKVGSARFGVCEKNVHHSGIPIGAENASHIINISAGYKSGKQADDAVTRIRDFIENGCV